MSEVIPLFVTLSVEEALEQVRQAQLVLIEAERVYNTDKNLMEDSATALASARNTLRVATHELMRSLGVEK